MFTRLDAERNAKNLKRALNNNKLTEEKYQEAVEKMDAYVSLPAKRFSELVKKYVHHRNMMRIEGEIRTRFYSFVMLETLYIVMKILLVFIYTCMYLYVVHATDW